MRIIGGRFKGRKLVAFKADHIRPTTDRVKETLFNILMSYVEGARVLDLFSGTGNLACEAISRGAASIDCVELNRKSLQIMHENFLTLGITNQVSVHAADALRYLKKYHGPPFDLVLIDPPFTEKMGHDVMEALMQSAVFGPETIITIEVSRHERLESQYGSLFRYNERSFGDKTVAFFRVKETPGGERI